MLSGVLPVAGPFQLIVAAPSFRATTLLLVLQDGIQDAEYDVPDLCIALGRENLGLDFFVGYCAFAFSFR